MRTPTVLSRQKALVLLVGMMLSLAGGCREKVIAPPVEMAEGQNNGSGGDGPGGGSTPENSKGTEGRRGAQGNERGDQTGNDQERNGTGGSNSGGEKGSGSGSGSGIKGESGGKGIGPTTRTQRPGAESGSSIGVTPPKTASEAASAAETELQKSDRSMTSGSLADAYRHAALALQSAEYFPDDPQCARLAENARLQLKKLEEKGISAAELKKKGNLGGKKIVEIE